MIDTIKFFFFFCGLFMFIYYFFKYEMCAHTNKVFINYSFFDHTLKTYQLSGVFQEYTCKHPFNSIKPITFNDLDAKKSIGGSTLFTPFAVCAQTYT